MGCKLFTLFVCLCYVSMTRVHGKSSSGVHDRLDEVELKDAKRKGEFD